MAAETRRALLLVVLAVACLGAAAPSPTASPTAVATAASASTFWQPVAFAGEDVSAVTANGNTVAVRVNGHVEGSDNAGRSWHATATLPAQPSGAWRVVNGRPALREDGRTHLDQNAPVLGTQGLVTSPASLPGYAVAVADDGVVWCRAPDGHWQQGLRLLPETLLVSSPRITSLTSFDTSPSSEAVYLGTDGYGVFISTDAGVDWLWANTGLPSDVLSLTTDAHLQRVYAATSNGLWMHQLAPLPSPPTYVDTGYWWRVVGIGAVVVLGCLVALLGMLRLLSPAASVSADDVV